MTSLQTKIIILITVNNKIHVLLENFLIDANSFLSKLKLLTVSVFSYKQARFILEDKTQKLLLLFICHF